MQTLLIACSTRRCSKRMLSHLPVRMRDLRRNAQMVQTARLIIPMPVKPAQRLMFLGTSKARAKASQKIKPSIGLKLSKDGKGAKKAKKVGDQQTVMCFKERKGRKE